MGTVHAKEIEGSTDMDNPAPRTRGSIDFKRPAKVQRVLIEGLERTKEDLLIPKVQDTFTAENFEQVVKKCVESKAQLQELGIFKTVQITVDTCKVPGASETAYDVKFLVEEKRFEGGIHTSAGNNDVESSLTLGLNNLFGRAEKLTAKYAHTRNFRSKKNNQAHIQFTKPLNGNPDVRLIVGGYNTNTDVPLSGYKEASKGILTAFTFPSTLGSHIVQWDGVWRDLRALTRTTPFPIREQAGHTLKSSVHHTLTADTRDDKILPHTGYLLKAVQEYAGLGGNVEFVKLNSEFQVNREILPHIVVQLSTACGTMWGLGRDKRVTVNDKFFLGGPLSLRGFQDRGVGPQVEGNALGADAYWLCAAHVYTPLPFKPGLGGFGNFFRSHAFVNIGNVGALELDKSVKENIEQLSEEFRLAYGVGVVLKLGNIARMELNYVVPVRVFNGDCVNPGIQFGVGVTFL
ncbi:sorting and assembly machinery component 50 homolog [Mizuhopecten yessoensis]|uniref:Sorting and assembly machinery component 50-like n=1 Tax=Mizuhopecten yessoensis TaxID=6573 RepID=A0A210QTH8_MIZYE|nr:sorting and assembly machinery component 50 homolog [Mizuhopecten yessoensis]OWF52048.1 Sorting and assembly machinery component 50-like [Mizuhopecten yessoensis]